MSESFERELRVGLEAVRQAALLCQAVQGEIAPEVVQKDDRSPVTVADFGSQALICRMLRRAFPDDPIIAEEDSSYLRQPDHGVVLDQVVRRVAELVPDAGSAEVCRWIDQGDTQECRPRFWTLDPIDGTKGFLRKQQYAISLALIVEGRIEVAALACPNLPLRPDDAAVTGVVFSAIRGRGAAARAIDDGDEAFAIHVSRGIEPRRARLCESVESGHTAHGRSGMVKDRLGITAPAVRLDSQGKYGVVARGQADVYLRLPTRNDYREKIWDHAGGVLVVTEAGGTVTDADGKALNFTLGRELSENRGVVATNGQLHDQVIEAVRSVLQ